MKRLIAFDLDGTLALSKQPLEPDMAETLRALLGIVDVAVISGGDWPQFEKQVASRLPADADLSRLWLMPTTGTKLYTHQNGAWTPVYAELFDAAERERIIAAFGETLDATGFTPRADLGRADRGSRQPDHLLRARAAGAARREGALGSRFRQAQDHPGRSAEAAARAGDQPGRRDQHRHHPGRGRQGLRAEEAARPRAASRSTR